MTRSTDRTFAHSDVVRQFGELVEEECGRSGVVHDVLIIGGGAAGAGVLRDMASRSGASALLVDRGPFGGETSSKTGKAIHPGIRYLRMAFHRLLLAFRLRRDPKIKQTFAQNLHGAWLDLQLVWYGTRERKILLESAGRTVEEIPNIVIVLPDSPETKWAVFFGISLYDVFTTLWAWFRRTPRFSWVRLFRTEQSLYEELPHLDAPGVLGGALYWDGKANNDKILVVKAIRDAYLRGTPARPIRALSEVEVESYEWVEDGGTDSVAGSFRVTLVRRFEHEELPERVSVRAHTIANGAGPWVDQVRNRTRHPDGRTSMTYSRGSHLEATNRHIHEALSADPRLQIGLVPLNAERQHYMRPFHQHGLWYIQLTTTDRPHTDPDLVVPTEDEIEELLRSYNHLVEERWRLERRDIFNVFCGIRPLASSGSGQISVQDLSRMFRIAPRSRGGGTVYDMLNVKLTEFRWAGSQLGDRIAADLRSRGIKTIGRSTTARMSFLTVTGEEPFGPENIGRPRSDRDFVRDKAAHYVRHQLATSYRDYLLNSGGVREAVVFDESGRPDLDLEVLDIVLAEMAERLGWSPARRRTEWEDFQEVYTRNLAFAELGRRVRDHEPHVPEPDSVIHE
jgi:glycerol-3-phosphate dehydrogenase